jgi:hypothetical protein
MNKIIEKLLSGFKPNKEELKAKLEKLKKDRYNARKAKEHHQRELKRSIDNNNMKKYQTHHAKRDFWDGRLAKIRQDILLVKETIKAQEEKEQAAAYKERLKAFDGVMMEGLKALLAPLDSLVETQSANSDIGAFALKIYNFYETSKKGFSSKDMAPYHQLGLLSVRIRCGNILEKVGDMQRISSLRGSGLGAQKREHIKLWSRTLANQIRDCIKTVKKRSE